MKLPSLTEIITIVVIVLLVQLLTAKLDEKRIKNGKKPIFQA